LRLFSFGGYVLALAALALVVFGADDSYPIFTIKFFSVFDIETQSGPLIGQLTYVAYRNPRA